MGEKDRWETRVRRIDTERERERERERVKEISCNLLTVSGEEADSLYSPLGPPLLISLSETALL